MSSKETLDGYNIFFSEISPLAERFSEQAAYVEAQSKLSKPDETIIQKDGKPFQEISNSDLHEYLSAELQPENQKDSTRKALEQLENLNDDEMRRLSEDANNSSLFRMLSQNYLGSFIAAGLFKLVTIIVLFAAPFFLDAISTSLKNKQEQDNTIIFIQSGLLAFSLLFFSVCDSQYSFHIQKLSSKLTLYLRTNLYAHALLKKSYSKSQKADSETDNIHADLNNLMTIDVSTVVNFLVSFHETWSLILKLLIGLTMLYFKMKSAVLVGFGVTVFLMLCNFCIAKSIGGVFERVLKQKDLRISLTRDILNGIRQIQLCNWQNVFFQKMLELRKTEFKYVSWEKYLDALCVFFWASSSLAISAVTFVLYYRDHNTFEDINVFTAIYLFEMLIGPLNAIPWTISGLYMSKTSFERFNQFFVLPNVYKYENKFKSGLAVQIKNIASQWPQSCEESSEKNDGKRESFMENIRRDNQNENRIIQKNKEGDNSDEFNNSNNNQGFATPRKSQQRIQMRQSNVSNSQTNLLQQPANSSHRISLNNMNAPQNNSNSSEFKFKLKIDQISIPKGSFVIVTGNTSAGKTALLQTILSELNVAQLDESKISSLKIEGSIAYVPQHPWLFNSSLRDNILFFTPYERKFYRACIFASCLHPDLQTFEDLDLTEVGVNGGRLSGGQQARASLARAFYSRKDIYLFDNIFSQIDAEVADHIFAFGLRSLLRDKTVILASSTDQYSQFADLIISINDNNEVDFFQNQNKREFNFNQHVDLNLVSIYETTALRKTNLSAQNELIETKNQQNPQNEPLESPNNDSSGMEEFLEPRQKGKLEWNIIRTYLGSIGCFFCFIIVLSMSLMQLSQNYYYVWLKDFVSGNSVLMVEDFITTLACLCGINLVVSLLRAFSFAYGNLLASQTIFLKLCSNVFFQKAAFFVKHSIGQILTRFANDTMAVDYSISFSLNIVLKNLFTIIGSFAVIASQIPLSLVIIFIIFIFYYFVQQTYRNASRELKRLDSANFSSLTSLVNESAIGIKTIRAFGQEYNLNNKFFQRLKNCNSSSTLLSLFSTWFSFRLQLLSLLLAFSLLAYTCAYIQFRELLPFAVDANTLALCLVYSIEITNLLRNLILSITSLEIEFVALERIEQLINDPDNSPAIKPPVTSNLAKSLKVLKNNFAVEFHEVFMSYDPQDKRLSNDTQNYALKGLTLQLEKGKKYAIVGRTGSGKSSILNCLMKLYDHQDGEVYVNGENVRYISPNAISNIISVVPQHCFLFKGSIRDNLDPQGEFSEQHIRTVLASIINSQSPLNNLDFQLEESGKNISEGEKQLLSLARVFLSKQQIICLDEATSHLDVDYEKLVVQLLHKFENSTAILITHRLQLLHYFDEIIVISDGSVVEQGQFQQLISNPNSFLNNALHNE